MDFQTRLYDLRKRAGLSQEQLAGLVGVTRQAVQKWEAGTSRPDMDNLAALAGYFNVSLDWLIAGREETPAAPEGKVVEKHYYYGGWQYEYKSGRALWGLPLVHIKLAQRGLCVARGIVAIGNVAVGPMAIGCFSLGLLSVGCGALGLLVLAGMGLGLAVVGGIAVGLLTLGGVSIGVVALGGSAVGIYAGGGAVFGRDAAIGLAAISDQVAIAQDAKAPVTLALSAPREMMAQAFAQAGVPGWVQSILLFWHYR